MAMYFLLAALVFISVSESYYVGVGRYDITGPAAGINMVLCEMCLWFKNDLV